MFDKKCLRLGLCTMACAAVVSFLPGLSLFPVRHHSHRL